MLPEFAVPLNSRDCIEWGSVEIMRSACTEEDVKALEDAMELFFTRRPVSQSTPPRADNKAARVLKTGIEISDAWRIILERRRLECDDARPITAPEALADMYTSWMREWLDANLSADQRSSEWGKQIEHCWCIPAQPFWRQALCHCFVAEGCAVGTSGNHAGYRQQRCFRARC